MKPLDKNLAKFIRRCHSNRPFKFFGLDTSFGESRATKLSKFIAVIVL